MSDEQDVAEQLDEDAIGTDPDVDDLPGLNRYVDVGPMSSEDPNMLLGGSGVQDDAPTRAWREEPDPTAADRRPAPREVIDLVEPDDGGVALVDDEQELIADAVRPADGAVGPEAGALHIETDG